MKAMTRKEWPKKRTRTIVDKKVLIEYPSYFSYHLFGRLECQEFKKIAISSTELKWKVQAEKQIEAGHREQEQTRSDHETSPSLKIFE